MPGKDTTGTYSTKDYVLGRGRMYFSSLDSNGLPKEWRDVGNVPNLTASVAEEELEHFTTRNGLKTRDLTVTLSKNVNLSFSLDTIVDQNLLLFFSGSSVDYTNPTIAGFSPWEIIAPGDVKSVTTWYQLTDSSGNPALGLDGTDLELASTDATAVVLVEDTDYELREAEGLFRLLDSTDVQAIIAGGAGITAELTANASAANADEVRALTQSQIVVAIKFVSENPANSDEQTIFDFHKVKLKSDGDFQLISDEWQQLPFSGTVEANDLAYPDSPHITVRTLKPT
jgi:hypothetical protein